MINGRAIDEETSGQILSFVVLYVLLFFLGILLVALFETDMSFAGAISSVIPPHYNQTGIECIDAISAATGDGYKYYLQGNIMKYLWRFDYKDKPVQDLEKAKWYLDRLIEEPYMHVLSEGIE